LRNREKPDHYTLKAKKMGYPARSVFKLEEMDQKMALIKPGYNVLDVGASPGSWTLYVLKKLKGRGQICAVDLKDLGLNSSWDNLHFMKGDVFETPTQEFMKDHGPYDILISDAAPSTTGNRTIDSGRSFSLVESIIMLSDSYVKTGGSIVLKIFQGGDEKQLENYLKERFEKVKRLKPKAVRKESFESYLIGMNKKEI